MFASACRPLTTAPFDVEAWFSSSGITIGAMANTPERVEKSTGLLYTWRECFLSCVRYHSKGCTDQKIRA